MSLRKSNARNDTKRTQNSNVDGRRKTIGKTKATPRSLSTPKNATTQEGSSSSTYNLRSRKIRPQRSANDESESDSRLKNRENFPEEYPDLDFHHTFGSFLTSKNPVSNHTSPEIANYWNILSHSPTRVQHYIHQIGDSYRKAFRNFFTADPISLHGHVSDASNAALLTSMISHLASHASPSHRISFFEDEAKTNPRVAVTENAYGAGYGCLAYHAVIDTVRPLANGPRPIVIKTNTASKIDAQVKRAKREGCIALIAEIVRAGDGKVMAESVWKSLLRACEKYDLVLVVDEALTSIRCGAPFACQLPQYAQHGYPDLILFGKAVRTNGIAVEWRGVNIQKLGIANEGQRMFTILDWQERLTEMAQAADLLISWGTLLLAERERWPQRAQEIGRVLRGLLADYGVRVSDIGGLHSLLYVRLGDIARLRSPIMSARAGKHVRLFPVMDDVMTLEEELRSKVFGPSSIAHRREISAYFKGQGLKLGFCSRCGNAVEAEVKSCQVCVVRVCEECEPGKHVCPMES